MSEDEDSFVTYGEPFEEDDSESSNFLYPKARPQAYELRLLNERGRPMRFHGAFTGGFSAGYFNTVGSKEGFKPQSFSSSRRNRHQNADQQVLSKPEDFMDEEDLGEFGIAPRHYRTRREFDDHHIFDTLSESLGGKSVIPGANDVLKRMLIPSGTSLGDRLLRRMGWKSEEAEAVLREEEADATPLAAPNKERDYAVISFAPKSNTFGLGYSGLDPEIAWGRRAPTSRQDPQSESVSSLQRREQTSHVGFNPSTGPVRQGIHGQAFGVGALHSEDADIYAQDSLASYDFSIGADDEHGNDEGDDELAELEAARHGRFSDLRKRKKDKSTIDGWTPPTLPKVLLSGVEEVVKEDILDGFVKPVNSGPCLVLTNTEFFVIPQSIILPPGYNAVFHPECLGNVDDSFQGDTSKSQASVSNSDPCTPLLKPFVSDSAKQARFETYQLLVRRGISHEAAYEQCSNGAIELTAETRGFEANVFATLVRNLAPAPPSVEKTAVDTSKVQQQEKDKRPLTAGVLDEEKHRLVANLLKSRFRSAGEMDITKELTEAEEEQRRRDIESLNMTDPRDNAVANESYGVLTRRTLTWHPAALLCRRVNVPNPYPNSTFVGCPDDRRFRRPPRRGKRRRDDITSSEFTLFQLLDMNVGTGCGDDVDNESDEYGEEEENGEEVGAGAATESKKERETSDFVAVGPPPTIFDALFAESAKAEQEAKVSEETSYGPSTAPPRKIGPARVPAPSDASNIGKTAGLPSMDLFKSIFASDEEPEDEDDLEEPELKREEPTQPPPSAAEFRSPAEVQVDENNIRGSDKNNGVVEAVPNSPLPSKPPPLDLPVHQLFKHLFNLEMDNDAPLFAVTNVAQQRREERHLEDTAAAPVAATEEDFYGPSLPPDFEADTQSKLPACNHECPTTPPPESVEFIEAKKHHRDTTKKEHRLHKHSHKHHHKHKRHKRDSG